MFIGNITSGQIASLVWNAASRTLTADPATDAGAATLVWAHATRTLTSDSLSSGSISGNVWTVGTRTLTADPATDAGAATLVWTHATRTLTADPATDAGAATLVWTHATRTLTADPATDAGAATLVWAHSARTLTSLTGSVSATAVAKTSIGASSTVNIQPSANHIFDICAAGDNKNIVPNLTDGTNAIGGGNVTNSGIGNLQFPSSFVGLTGSVFLQIQNADGVSAHSYIYSGKVINVS